jgi:hypothetical protein
VKYGGPDRGHEPPIVAPPWNPKLLSNAPEVWYSWGYLSDGDDPCT